MGRETLRTKEVFLRNGGGMWLLLGATQWEAQDICTGETKKLFTKWMNENCSFSSGDKVGFLLLCDAF